MKRFWRWMFNGAAALSLLLCVATGIVWVRSYWVQDSFDWSNGAYEPVIYEDWRTIDCACGGVLISHEHFEWDGSFAGEIATGHSFTHDQSQQKGYPYFVIFFQWAPPTTDMRIKGFEFVYLHDRGGDRIQSVTFPLAVIFVPALFLPALWARRKVKRRRLLKGNFCLSCGYDLRATPERCPECGTVRGKA